MKKEGLENTRKMELCDEIIRIVNQNLMLRLRFLNIAVHEFGYKAGGKTIGTDGEYIWYEPNYLLSHYSKTENYLNRVWVHMIFHCVFRNWDVRSDADRARWNLACDMVVEHTIIQLGIDSLSLPNDLEKKRIVEGLGAKKIIPSKVYQKLATYSDEQVGELQSKFLLDDHSCWQVQGEDQEKSLSQKDCSNQAKRDATWKEIAHKVEVELETFEKSRGNHHGSVIVKLKEVNREEYDYADFLKKFSVLSERVKANYDEFDYIFYTYGLSLYGNVPLIEPLEYKEEKVVKEFVIAIDTSASTSGYMVQGFLRKTYNMLLQQENFAQKVNVHIIQCDMAITQDTKITNVGELETYISQMEIHGGGGTDFRPVFRYVEVLRKEGEFKNLGGLIYFTDGDGLFPTKRTDYNTAFVFLEHNFYMQVPPWAYSITLDENKWNEKGQENEI